MGDDQLVTCGSHSVAPLPSLPDEGTDTLWPIVFQTGEFLSNLSLWHDSKIHPNNIDLLKAAEKPSEFGCNKIGHSVSAKGSEGTNANGSAITWHDESARHSWHEKISERCGATALPSRCSPSATKGTSVLPNADVERGAHF
jgi:hypothetical protein